MVSLAEVVVLMACFLVLYGRALLLVLVRHDSALVRLRPESASSFHLIQLLNSELSELAIVQPLHKDKIVFGSLFVLVEDP